MRSDFPVKHPTRYAVLIGCALVSCVLSLVLYASDSHVYFSTDPQGQVRVSEIEDGTEVYLVVIDNDENTNCREHDSIAAEAVVLDPSSGAYLHWDPSRHEDHFVETGEDTGVFASSRTIRIGGRPKSESASQIGHSAGGLSGGSGFSIPGQYVSIRGTGRVENGCSIVFVYTDPSDPTDTSVAVLRVKSYEGFIEWDRYAYCDDCPAVITVMDPDENTDGSLVEELTVFLVVDPAALTYAGSAPVERLDALVRLGGFSDTTGQVLDEPIRWYNIDSNTNNVGVAYNGNLHEAASSTDGRYYLQYSSAMVPASFVATETAPDSGVFQTVLPNLGDTLSPLQLEAGSLLLALYLDPNDPSDVALSTAVVGLEASSLSTTEFTDTSRAGLEYYDFVDSCQIQVIDVFANIDKCCPDQVGVSLLSLGATIDSERLVLFETSCNSPIFFSSYSLPWEGQHAQPVELQAPGYCWVHNGMLDRAGPSTLIAYYSGRACEFEVCDTHYEDGASICRDQASSTTLSSSGSADIIRVESAAGNDYGSTEMYFLDRQGNRVLGYVGSDCVFIEVVDPSQNLYPSRLERITSHHEGSPLPFQLADRDVYGNPQGAGVLVVNVRNRQWARLDLYETHANSGAFVSRSCVRVCTEPGLIGLDSIPGDTLLAYYQNPLDSNGIAAITIRISRLSLVEDRKSSFGPIRPPSSIQFVDESGDAIDLLDYETAFRVRVQDGTHVASAIIPYSVSLTRLDELLHLYREQGAEAEGSFLTETIVLADLGFCPGDSVAATYADPRGVSEKSETRANVIGSSLVFAPRFTAYETRVVFVCGTGAPESFVVRIADRFGALVRTIAALPCSATITWGLSDDSGQPVPVGIYTIEMTVRSNEQVYEHIWEIRVGE